MNIYKIFTLTTFLLFTSCGSTTKLDSNSSSNMGIDLQNSSVYNSSSPYAKKLQTCIIDSSDKSCSLNDLPLIRESYETITASSIKDRLVVSHKWMGDRLLEMLDIMQPDIKKLFGATTAIVIDDSVNPAFYTTNSGAIYLDPRYLWLTPSEANDIEKRDDFRKDYGDDLKFIPAWRYVKNSANVMGSWDVNNPTTRSREDIKLNLERLLYHELSHANDFANVDVIDGANRDAPLYIAIGNRMEYTISSKLYNSIPLTDETLKHLASVLYKGVKSTAEDDTIEPSEVGAFFETDSATNMYSFTNQYEDFAMLFETAMMKYHYNIDMDIAFVSVPEGAKHTCNDYVVGWGARDYIAKASIKPRAKFVLDSIYPDKSSVWGNFLNSLSEPTMLPNNGWCESINSNSIRARKTNKDQEVPVNDFLPPYM